MILRKATHCGLKILTGRLSRIVLHVLTSGMCISVKLYSKCPGNCCMALRNLNELLGYSHVQRLYGAGYDVFNVTSLRCSSIKCHWDVNI